MLDVVIPAAGMGRRMRSYGPKGLIKLRPGETVLSRQIRLIRSSLPVRNVFVVAGFQHERMQRACRKTAQVIVNDAYETTNVARSVQLGLEQCGPGPVLVVLGDLVFNPSIFSMLPLYEASCVVVDETGGRKEEVGLCIVDSRVTYLCYSLPKKWAGVMMLASREREMFRRLAADPRHDRFFVYEILNHLIDDGGELFAIPAPGLVLSEVDRTKDLVEARRAACAC